MHLPATATWSEICSFGKITYGRHVSVHEVQYAGASTHVNFIRLVLSCRE